MGAEEKETDVASALPPTLPVAQEALETLCHAMAVERLVIFLDYDGTLTPIVPRPEDAHLPPEMRTALASLAHRCPVAIVSGRDLVDVQARVNLPALYYAGSHGFEISGPAGLHDIYEPAHAFLDALDDAESMLQLNLSACTGVQLERKHFTMAIHYRHVPEAQVDTVLEIVAAVQQAFPTLRQTGGKKVVELRPALEWDKGTALFWLLDVMGMVRDTVVPVYIGDDVTDEDAFVAIRQQGVGILVADEPRQTAARYYLPHTRAVHAFLTTLATMEPRSAQP
jgi:alpha,alpha-trehalase